MGARGRHGGEADVLSLSRADAAAGSEKERRLFRTFEKALRIGAPVASISSSWRKRLYDVWRNYSHMPLWSGQDFVRQSSWTWRVLSLRRLPQIHWKRLWHQHSVRGWRFSRYFRRDFLVYKDCGQRQRTDAALLSELRFSALWDIPPASRPGLCEGRYYRPAVAGSAS